MNKETLDIFGQLLSGKQVVLGKPRQKLSRICLSDWQVTFDKHIRSNKRKESIKKLFNI